MATGRAAATMQTHTQSVSSLRPSLQSLCLRTHAVTRVFRTLDRFTDPNENTRSFGERQTIPKGTERLRNPNTMASGSLSLARAKSKGSTLGNVRPKLFFRRLAVRFATRSFRQDPCPSQHCADKQDTRLSALDILAWTAKAAIPMWARLLKARLTLCVCVLARLK